MNIESEKISGEEGWLCWFINKKVQRYEYWVEYHLFLDFLSGKAHQSSCCSAGFELTTLTG